MILYVTFVPTMDDKTLKFNTPTFLYKTLDSNKTCLVWEYSNCILDIFILNGLCHNVRTCLAGGKGLIYSEFIGNLGIVLTPSPIA